MEKRKNPRYAVTLDALVHPATGRSWLCTIRDFCAAGMLLVDKESDRGRRTTMVAKPGDQVGIHFTVPLDRGDLHFRLEGKIVRVAEGAAGINFPGGLADNVITALLEFANKSMDFGDEEDEEPEAPAPPAADDRTRASTQARTAASPREPPRRAGERPDPRGAAQGSRRDQVAGRAQAKIKSDSRITNRQAEQIIAECRKRVVRVVPEMNSAFFAFMDDELLAMARGARSNDLQNEYFSAMSILEGAKKNVGEAFAADVLHQIDHPQKLEAVLERRRARETEGQSDQARVRLSLVNTEEFEDWLAVANIVVRAERMYSKYLVEIQTRMGMLVDSWSHNEVNPLGPSVFARAFDDAIRKVDLNKEIREKVYAGFEKTIVPLLRTLYRSVTEMFDATKLFPDIEDGIIVPSPVRRIEIPDKDTKARAEPEEEAAGEAAEEGEPAPRAVAPESRRRPPPAATPQQRAVPGRAAPPSGGAPARPASGGAPARPASAGAPARPAAVAGAREAPPPRGRRTQQTLRRLYSTVQTLLDESMAEDLEEDYPEEDLYHLEEVQDALNSLQQERLRDPGTPLRGSIREQMSRLLESTGGTRRIAPAARQGMAVVENLVKTFDTDAMLSPSARDWIRQLEITLNKVAAADTDFLDQGTDHKALDLINQLAELGAAESSGVKRTVDRVVNRIAESYDGDDGIFDEAIEELRPLLDRQTRAYAGNVQRAVRTSEGQQVLKNAQTAVVEEVGSRLGGQRIPEVIMRLLVPGWRNLLVNTHLRKGQGSPEWQRGLQVLEQLLMHLDDRVDPSSSPGYIPPDELLREIETGLDSIAYEPGQRAPLLRALQQVIEGKGEPSDLSMVELPATRMADALGLGALEEREERRRQILAEEQDVPDWRRWYARVSRLHVGEWLEIGDDRDEGEVAIVAWVSDEGDNFVFVNRRGVKTHELLSEELTQMLMRGQARILEESDLPLTDRASHRMLQEMHNQLTHQATHDDLTGLGNRKAFERQIDRALADSRRRGLNHMVAYVDLDQFKVINSTSGYDAGDALLVSTARLLERSVPEKTHFIFRIGGNDFGVLIENCDADEGQRIVRSLCDAIKRDRFAWEGTEYSLTASAGCVAIDKTIEDAASILQAADEARYAAKEAGRDRIQLFKPGDMELAQRHGIMEFVSQIDKALEQNRFVLNCQKISPIDNPEENPHYEILLTVLDEKGKPLPPQDFIVAAESYDRMGAIDRWVIRNAFDWIASNILKLESLGAFSINISGNSLNEEDFMDFVLKQFNETRLPTSKVCFEITETAAISSLAGAIDFMNKLKVIGVKFSLDDFGSGLSSYSYLRDLPIDYLKIDGIFVKDIATNPNDYAVVKSINEIGHFMGKKTIAEYVEDETVLDMLREIGVDYAQGYGIEKKRVLAELV